VTTPWLLSKIQRGLYYYVFRNMPFRAALERFACSHFRGLPAYVRVERLYRLRAFRMPHYYLGVQRALDLSARLGLSKFSILEFGVAEGNGLLCLQNILHAVSGSSTFVCKQVRIFGFDTFQGLPDLSDARDGGSVWKKGDYPSDLELLRSKIDPALVTLVPGLFADSIPTVRDQLVAYPPLFIIVDSDLYTSTISIFDHLFPSIVPSVSYWYFDDTRLNFYSERVGERLAIAEFNRRPDNPYHFVTDYRASEEPIPLFRVLTQLYYCIDDEHYVDQTRLKEDPAILSLNPEEYVLLPEQNID